MCGRGVDFDSVSMIIQLDFGTFPTVWYSMFFVLSVSIYLAFFNSLVQQHLKTFEIIPVILQVIT